MGVARRVQFDIDGTEYTLPINPIVFDHGDNIDFRTKKTVDGRLNRFVAQFDQRIRKMRWENLPNTEVFQDMVATLKSAIDVPNIRMNERDLSIYENIDYWKDILIHNVVVNLNQQASEQAISKLRYDVDLTFSYIKEANDQFFGLFNYTPGDYANDTWITSVSGFKNMDVIICNPDLGTANVTALRGAFPNAHLLMYTNAQDMPAEGYASTSPFHEAMSEVMYLHSGLMITTLVDGGVPGPEVGWQLRNIAGASTQHRECAMNLALAKSMAYTISGNCMGTLDTSSPQYAGFEYDGVYVDMYTASYYHPKSTVIGNWIASGWTFDADDDGSADSLADIQIMYEGGKAHLISGLRESLPDKIIIGNTAGVNQGTFLGGAYHPGLNGFTIENPGWDVSPNIGYHTPTHAQAQFIFKTQQNLSQQSPIVNIAWATAATASGTVQPFAERYKNIRYGYHRNFWDGLP